METNIQGFVVECGLEQLNYFFGIGAPIRKTLASIMKVLLYETC